MDSWRAVEVADLPRRPDGQVDLPAVAAACADPVLLETAGTAGWHYLAIRSIGRVVDDGVSTALHAPDGPTTLGSDPFAAIDELGERWGLHPDNRDRGPLDPGAIEVPAFTGGLVGAWSYDLARRVERLPSRAAADRPTGGMDLRLADLVLACPPDGGVPLLVHRELGGPAVDLDEVAGELARRSRTTPAPAAAGRTGRSGQPTAAITSLPRDAHERAVLAALDHIAAGDAFQINVTGRLSAPWAGDVWELYRRMRQESPAAYGAVIPALADGSAIASISPETFLGAVGRDVTIRPIKGTRPRGSAVAADTALAEDLRTSPKDRAENVMVVDMERNDLGRVCLPGSVHVPELLAVEQHPTVWHLVSTVTGTLSPDVGWGGLMRATFPCGSITGTPKVRAMELIDELEPVRRGWYCGALGFLSAGGMSTSVAIRTAVLWDDVADYGAGGGIVADSDPAAEWTELLDKAAAFLRAVGAELT